MTVPFLDLQAQYRSIKSEVDPAIQHVLDTSAYILGPAVEQFEIDFATFCGADHCIGVNSGTSALALLMQSHGIGPGDEVITVANTFFATAEAISNIGATPILIDCDLETGLMDPRLLEAVINPQTKAIIPVHLYGQPANMDAINAIAQTRKLLVFEDACQAHGAIYKGKRAGNLADGAAFSFYPGKNLGAYGEGGCITTNNPEIATKTRMLRDHGMPRKYYHAVVGWNERMDGMQGAVLGVKLKHLDAWNAARKKHAATYAALLPEAVEQMGIQDGSESVYHLFVIRIKNRESVQKKLTEKGIATGIHYPVAIHMQPAYAGRWKKGDFPNAERLSDEILSLPMFPELTDAHIREVTDAVASAIA